MNKDHYYESRRNHYAYLFLWKSSGKSREVSEDIADFMLTWTNASVVMLYLIKGSYCWSWCCVNMICCVCVLKFLATDVDAVSQWTCQYQTPCTYVIAALLPRSSVIALAHWRPTLMRFACIVMCTILRTRYKFFLHPKNFWEALVKCQEVQVGTGQQNVGRYRKKERVSGLDCAMFQSLVLSTASVVCWPTF